MSGFVVWLTGLSGAGKSTICEGLNARAAEHMALRSVAIDGDLIRRGLCADLGFTAEDRSENVRRVAHVSALLADLDFAVTVALISPYEQDRDQARDIIGHGRFRLVHVRAPLTVCEERDPKGLYKRARAGEIAQFTGVTAPYEEPENAHLVVDTAAISIRESVDMVWDFIGREGLLPLRGSGAGI